MDCLNACIVQGFVLYNSIVSTFNLIVLLLVVLCVYRLFHRFIRCLVRLDFLDRELEKVTRNDAPGAGYGGEPALVIPRETPSGGAASDSPYQACTEPSPFEGRAVRDRPPFAAAAATGARRKPDRSPVAARLDSHAPVGALSGKFGRSLSLSRLLKRSKRDSLPAAVGPHQSLRQLTTELNRSEKFNRASDEIEAGRAGASDGAWGGGGGGGGSDQASEELVTPGQKGAPFEETGEKKRGNDYQVTVLSTVPEPQGEQSPDPYYFKLMQDGDTDGDAGDDGPMGAGQNLREFRERRSLSDANHLYFFPLKKTGDKSGGAAAKGAKKAKGATKRRVGRPISPDYEYEPVSKGAAPVAVPAEPQGEYSKLNRRMVKEEEALHMEGYDRLVQGDLPGSSRDPRSAQADAKLGRESR